MACVFYSPEAFSDDLRRVILASRNAHAVRACLLTTRDRDHAFTWLKQVVSDADWPLYGFTVAARRRYNFDKLKWEAVGGESSDTLGLLRHAQELRNGAVVVLEDCAAFLRDEGGDQRVRMSLAEMLSSETITEGLVLVFLEPPEAAGRLPAILADQFVRLEVPYPRASELEAIARAELSIAAHHARVPMDVESIREKAEYLARELAGLTRTAARDALRDALAPNPSDLDAAFARLQRRKALTLRESLGMNVLDTLDVEEPIGLDYLFEYIEVIQPKLLVTGEERAKGIWLIGPPGTGKTMIARSIGRHVKLPVVEFRVSSLMNSLLGETENRFRRAFATLEAMSPNVALMDEIEKAFGDSSERDGGTMMRATGALLSWLSDNPHPNFIVATSNSLRRMGEIGQTMTRSERFDAFFFVDVPCLDSRRRMLERWLADRMPNCDAAADELAQLTEKFSGADLRSLVKRAVRCAEHDDVVLTLDMVKTQVERKRMRALALYDEFQELRRWGMKHCEPAGLTDTRGLP
ncbi:MAG: ATP-binding protein [Deltaproteobacteria bacterium]|nr:ATP-binding protein [Deltaproteobacteria bacterium]